MAHKSDLIAEDIEAYLKAHEHKSLLRFITCGSVDDGKSTLIGRLLYESKMIFEDQLAALEADSKKMGTQGGDLDFALPPLAVGIHSASVEVPPDNLPLDNAFHFLLRVKEKLPCLCVGPAADAPKPAASPAMSAMRTFTASDIRERNYGERRARG